MVPVLVERAGGLFLASLFGDPAVRAAGDTRDGALAALSALLDSRAETLWAATRAPGGADVVGLGGYWVGAGNPVWPAPAAEADPELIAEVTREMVAEIYRERDAQKAAEFPE